MGEIKEKTLPKPFLRWAGGKTWLLPHISELTLGHDFEGYVEPFLGGGAVYFHLNPEAATLSDLNSELIETYQTLRDSVEEIIQELSKYINTKEFYYDLRNKRPQTAVAKAARFIFLNQTSFNGIYRVNLKGEYNVPYGYRKKHFLEKEALIAASNSLKGTVLKVGDFSDSINDINAGDLVFLDPPYTVTHNDNGFIKYNAKLFDWDAQLRLASFIDEVKEKGAFYILTNAAHNAVREVFARNGDKIMTVSRASLVGGKLAQRGKYEEFVFTNLD